MDLVTVLIVSYDRKNELRKSLYGFLKNVQYPKDKLRFHLADDKSPGSLVEDVIQEFKWLNWSYTITNRKGWGGNVNAAMRAIKTDYIFLMEDDRQAYGAINLVDGVKLLKNIPAVGLVRYDGIAGHTTLTLNLKECKAGRFSYCTIDKQRSRRPIIYSNQPHLRHRRFNEFYGLYKEGLKLGKTEREYALWFHKAKGPDIAILEDGIMNRFNHLGAGKSRQHTKYDVGK